MSKRQTGGDIPLRELSPAIDSNTNDNNTIARSIDSYDPADPFSHIEETRDKPVINSDARSGGIIKKKIGLLDKIISYTTVITEGGNQGRDNLSAERTVLAYIRTAVNFVALGIAILQLFKYISEDSKLSILNTDKSLIKKLSAESQKIVKHLEKGAAIESHLAKATGFVAVIFGLLVLCFAYLRYFKLLQLINSDNKFENGSFEVILVSIVCLFVCTTFYGYSIFYETIILTYSIGIGALDFSSSVGNGNQMVSMPFQLE